MNSNSDDRERKWQKVMNWAIGFVTSVHTSIISRRIIVRHNLIHSFATITITNGAESTSNSNYHTLQWNYSNAIADSMVSVDFISKIALEINFRCVVYLFGIKIFIKCINYFNVQMTKNLDQKCASWFFSRKVSSELKSSALKLSQLSELNNFYQQIFVTTLPMFPKF